MRQIIFTLLCVSLTQSNFAKKFSFKLTNTTAYQIQVSAQLIKGVEKDNPDFLFLINSKDSKEFDFKVKSGEKVKFIGIGGGIETLPLVKSFDNLSSKSKNEYQLVVPTYSDRLNTIELNDAIAKLKNDNIMRVLTDSFKYSKDELPILGTFLFINSKSNRVTPLIPTYWKNENSIRKSLDNQYFKTTNYIDINNAASLSTSGVPFLKSLSTSFSSSNIMELVWDLENAHFEQWQPNDKNVLQILQDPANSSYIRSWVKQMRDENLGGGDYQLLFISSVYIVDKITISARKYTAVSFNADIDFQLPPAGVEVVQPVGVDASYKYTRAITYTNKDSSLNAYIKFLSQDYTSALNTYLSEEDIQTQLDAALVNAESLKSSITQQYSVLQSLDSSLIKTSSIDVIIPISSSTTALPLKREIIDTTNTNITPNADIVFNRKIRNYNSILASLKDNVNNYKVTLASIEKLRQDAQTDYQNISNLTNTIELNKKILDSYSANMKK
jgi:hypothetical protein